MSLKKSLHCRSEASDVHDPSNSNNNNLTSILTKKSRSGCSRSISNLRDVVIHGSKRHLEKQPICSPRSIGSSELINPIAHQVVFRDSRCELKITGGGGGSSTSTTFVGTLTPGTPGPLPRKSPPPSKFNSSRFDDGSSKASYAVTCPKCGDQFPKWEAAEAHHLSNHAGLSITFLNTVFLSALIFTS